MIESTNGLVLRTRPLTETSLIVNWLTPDLGRLSTVAKGARRTKSPFRGKLDLFYLAGFSFVRSRRSELHTLREVSLQETHGSLRQELGKFQQACYCAALIEQVTEAETPLPIIYDLLLGLLGHLPALSTEPKTLFTFEIKLLSELGLEPNLETSHLNPGTKLIFNALRKVQWGELSRIKLSSAQNTELSRFLRGFLTFHLGKVPKNRPATIEK